MVAFGSTSRVARGFRVGVAAFRAGERVVAAGVLRAAAKDADVARVAAGLADRVVRVAGFVAAAALRVVVPVVRLVALRVVVARFAGVARTARFVAVAEAVRLAGADARAGVLRVLVAAFARVAVVRAARVAGALRAAVVRVVVVRFVTVALRVAGLRVAVARVVLAGVLVARVVFVVAVRPVEAARVVRAVAARVLVVRVAVARVVLAGAFVARVVFTAALREPGFGPGLAPERAGDLVADFAAPRVEVLVALAGALLAVFFAGAAVRPVAGRLARAALVRAVVPATRRPPVRTAIARLRRPSVFSSLLMGVPSGYQIISRGIRDDRLLQALASHSNFRAAPIRVDTAYA
ncbi:hypothetical protein NFI95_14565 [Acetobacteraceae bacterium KSS8]|uniref:Uncharacterized protein n=1 Tax=Endosaccharibacter trunci TaxID=2812733 RepID=A0ABT1W9V0_9PROT|nr:hypothetical protein [Acetobacteraceae bacterium KSS8]